MSGTRRRAAGRAELARNAFGSTFGRLLLAFVATLAMSGLPARAAEPIPVRVGLAQTSSDVGFFIADKKGYFKQEGLAVTFTPFDLAAKMIAPLGAGQLDVGGITVRRSLQCRHP